MSKQEIINAIQALTVTLTVLYNMDKEAEGDKILQKILQLSSLLDETTNK